MKPRNLELGDSNITGKRVTEVWLAQGVKQAELLAKCSAPELTCVFLRFLCWKIKSVPCLWIAAEQRIKNRLHEYFEPPPVKQTDERTKMFLTDLRNEVLVFL